MSVCHSSKNVIAMQYIGYGSTGTAKYRQYTISQAWTLHCTSLGNKPCSAGPGYSADPVERIKWKRPMYFAVVFFSATTPLYLPYTSL